MPIAAALLFAVAAAANARWVPVNDAIRAAGQNGQLILLHFRTGDNDDKYADAWIAKAMQSEAVARAVASMNLAETRRKTPALLVLDQGGNELLWPGSAFRNVNQFAVTLASLNHNAQVFAASAELRRQKRVAEAELVRGNGLLRSGEVVAAREAFNLAVDHAQKEKNALTEQRARLGMAGIDLDDLRVAPQARVQLSLIARDPLSPDVAVTAWLLLGHDSKKQRHRQAAIDAYQKAWRAAEKPSKLADVARAALEMMGATPASDVAEAAATGAVHLVFARKPVMAGTLEVKASAPASTARVEFLLDGARVVEDSSAPYSATIKLGTALRTHTIAARAFDTHNRVLGEESATINDVVDALSVRLAAPQSIESHATILAEPRAPAGATIEGVDVYWSEKKLATLTAPPYRYELTLPSKYAAGYVRVLARDSTGATAEDVKMVNVAGAAEEMRVDLVELYAIVQDRGGHNVEGLTSRDFVVKEDGAPVAAEVHGTPNDPITVGFALDTSGSMRALMVDVAEDAAAFVSGSLQGGDQAFVVGFTDTPRLVQPLTGDLQHVTTSILDIDAGGATSIWDSLIFSLQQFRPVKGKRALLLFTDGADTTSTARYETALAVAQEVGVPVYVFLMRAGAGPPWAIIDIRRLDALAAATGGAMFRSPRKGDLPRLFAQIRDDTRGEYLLSFHAKSARPHTELRTISVSVPGRDAVVRAMRGYYPR